jgi:hypothetical protein
VGATRARSASIFVLLHVLHRVLVSTVFCRQGFVDEAAREQDRRVDEMPARDFQPSCRELAVDARELEASIVNAIVTPCVTKTLIKVINK